MTVRNFEPKFMKLGVLTAALQELTPRSVRDPDPDRAIEDWLYFGREVGADVLQLSAALHPSESDVPAETTAPYSAFAIAESLSVHTTKSLWPSVAIAL